jgi:putative transposase
MTAHLVFVTKYRRHVLTNMHLDRLKVVFSDVCSEMGVELLEFNGEDDHVHLSIRYPPRLSISEIVNVLKGVSARRLRSESFIKTHREHLWSGSYFAGSTGGATLDALKSYIQGQRRPTGRHMVSPPA